VTDVVIRGGTLVTPSGPLRADLAIADGTIHEISADLPDGREDIDANGLVVLPGVIDAHLHFNEPGRTDWEGAATGSRALAAGGGTAFFDMPLNSTPCTVNAQEFDRKRAALEASSITDFALWGGLVPGSIPDMAEMAARGAVGFKAFMCNSGLPEFPRADDVTLLDGLREAARLNLPVAVHASGPGARPARRPRRELEQQLDRQLHLPWIAHAEAQEPVEVE
jgi:allantoinase